MGSSPQSFWQSPGPGGAPKEFLFIAHLQPASITMRPGDRVSAGQAVGRVGSSGNSSEPHVHLHLQHRPTPSFGEAIPFYFHGYRLGGREVVRGMPRGGRTIRGRVRTGAFTGDIIEHNTTKPSKATRAHTSRGVRTRHRHWGRNNSSSGVS
jgi:murein DD-endopeptidase MepM/ murein hydrolase activator NlpD